MNSLQKQQRGGSMIATLITLTVLAYAIYVGIQYMPHMIESKSIDSILDDLKSAHNTETIRTVESANGSLIRMLQINEMDDMRDSFSITKKSGGINIVSNYERELNLIYETKTIVYEKSIRLE